MNANEAEQQQFLVERFLSAYTRIEQFLRDNVTGWKDCTTPDLAQDFCELRPGLDISPYKIRTAMNLRHALSHGQVKAGRFPAYPTEEFVQEVERIAKRFTNPPLITSRCKRQVETASPDDSLRALLIRMSELQLSQFPVYTAGKFVGLISENSIARWIAERARHERCLNFAEVQVETIVNETSDSSAYRFVPERTTEPEAVQLFASNALLGACLITKFGNQHEELLGIVTRWDIPVIMAQLTAPLEDASAA